MALNRPALIALALAVCVVRSGLAIASPQDLFGFGSRSSAMGATGAAVADDYAAVYANPAGLSRARTASFTLGYVTGSYALWTAQPSDAAAQRLYVDHARATLIGLTLPLPFGGVLQDRIGVGLGFYTPTDVVVRGRILRPDTPQFLVLADRAQSVALQLGIGISLPLGIRIGAGFAALAAIAGTVVIAADASGRVGSRVDDQLVASYAPTVGLSWERGPFRIGMAYRGELVGRFGVTITANDIGLPLPPFNIAGIAQYDPWEISGEAGIVLQGWTASAGATFKAWSGYPGPLERTTATSTRPPDTNFRDIVVVRVGVERRWDFGSAFFAGRAGYWYEPTPAPAVNVPSRSAYLDNDRHVATAGFALGGRLLGTTVSTELFAQIHSLVTRSSVTDATGTGPVTQSIRYGGALYVLGLSATVTF